VGAIWWSSEQRFLRRSRSRSRALKLERLGAKHDCGTEISRGADATKVGWSGGRVLAVIHYGEAEIEWVVWRQMETDERMVNTTKTMQFLAAPSSGR
jgi:hypothetical protein